jgi:hypothetical protein
MNLAAFTLFHVILSLLGIGSGLIVFYGLLTAKRFDTWSSLFLWTTLATSVTGFMFPFKEFLPSHAFGIISILLLAAAFPARYRYRLEGGWGRHLADRALPQCLRPHRAELPQDPHPARHGAHSI